MAEPPTDYVLLWDEQFPYANGPLNYDARGSIDGMPLATSIIGAGNWLQSSAWNFIVENNAIRNGTAAEMRSANGCVAKQIRNIPAGAINGDWNLRFVLRLVPGPGLDEAGIGFGINTSLDVAGLPNATLSANADGTAAAEIIGGASGPFAWDPAVSHDFIWRKRGVTHSILVDGVQRAFTDFPELVSAPWLGIECDNVIGGGSAATVKIERIQFHWLPRYEGGAV